MESWMPRPGDEYGTICMGTVPPSKRTVCFFGLVEIDLMRLPGRVPVEREENSIDARVESSSGGTDVAVQCVVVECSAAERIQ